MFLKPIENEEVLWIINKLKDESATGFNKITVKLLKNFTYFITKPLIYIFNISIRQGVFLDKFKLAIVKHLFKSGSSEDVSNYRPIYTLSNFSKIFEKVTKGRLITFLENELDNDKNVVAIFIDLAEAIDTVNHNIF